MKLLAILIALLSISLNTAAFGGIDDGIVIEVRVDKSGLGYVAFGSPLTSQPPTCTQAGYANALAFNTNEAGGRAVLSIVLAAQASGKKINARGTGTCSLYGVMEDWNWGLIANPI